MERGAVTGAGKTVGVYQSTFNGFAEKLLMMELNDQTEGADHRSSERRSLETTLEES